MLGQCLDFQTGEERAVTLTYLPALPCLALPEGCVSVSGALNGVLSARWRETDFGLNNELRAIFSTSSRYQDAC